MAITADYDRPKLDGTLTEALAITPAVAEVGQTAVVDLTATIAASPKTLMRIVIPLSQSGVTLDLTNVQVYAFAGDSTNYSAGGTVPPLSEATAVRTVDLDAYFTAAGDPRVNS